MPSPFTSSFASAAAGTANTDGSGGRTIGGEWARTRTNGATQTFRRPSATSSLMTQRDHNQSTLNPTSSSSSVYVPPHMASAHLMSSGRNGADTRYSKDQLLDVFRTQEKVGQPSANITDLFVDGWHPSAPNGIDNGGWGRKDDHREPVGSDICWDHEGSVQPIGLTGLSEEEREIFSTSVNSSLKPATNPSKDGTPRDGLNRRTSTSQASNMNNSPATRPSGRRRESLDVLQSRDPLSPSNNNRYSKDESGISSPPPSLLRRKTDFKESSGQVAEHKDAESNRQSADSSSPFGSLKRTSTGPVNANLSGPSSPWSNAPQSAGFVPKGAFGSFAAVDSSASEKRPGFSSFRSESRFKGLMNASSSENIGSGIKEKTSQSNLEKLTESADEQPSSKWPSNRRSVHNQNKDAFPDDEDMPAGSAALGGEDASPPLPQSRYRNPDQQASYDDIGFSSVGMSSEMPPFREMMQRREMTYHQTPQPNKSIMQTNEPMSPTDTNPYQSPEGERAVPNEIDREDHDFPGAQFHGGPGFGSPTRNFPNQFDSLDRSQSSSTSASKPFSNLGGLGNMSGLGSGNPWSAAPGAIGTPSRAQPAQTPGFGEPPFSNFGDLNSQAGAFGGSGFFGTAGHPGNAGVVGRGSRLGSLFPNSTHDHSLNEGQRQEAMYRDSGDVFSPRDSGYVGGSRDVEGSHIRGGQSEDRASTEKRVSGHQHFSSLEKDPNQPPNSALGPSPFSGAPSNPGYFARAQEQEGPSNQLPASQQRQMVMPDRMRWIYRDPQGAMQGPWSGLEMHDWYKAGFFSPELQVRKQEDQDYEPLAQLIRRIGNSREPFLVPQIGIPHGDPKPSNTAVPGGTGTPSGAQPSSAQPPFASSFPSFGTTLTAEQQNALERRKQEEQYLMARQKEYLAQQQVYLKQMHMQGGIHGQQLHHQSSGQSLHSQPSFGSITSPPTFQGPGQGPNQPPAAMPGFFDGSMRGGGPLGVENSGATREEDMPGYMERLNIGRANQLPFQSSHGLDHQQQVNAMLQERARLAREQEQYETLHRNNEDARATAERLEQYKHLRAQEGDQQLPQPGPAGTHGSHPQGPQQSSEDEYEEQFQPQPELSTSESLSLSEQVQKAAAKQPSAVQPQSPWAKVETGMPQPLPPPQSASPMPAPTPQRNRQSVAEALNAESQSPSQTDSLDTPSATVAPWAKENNETTKGPSLKEIQEMEAQKAAQREEIQAAARRAVAEHERFSQQNQVSTAVPTPGLPSSANWASGVPPAIPAATGGSAWTRSSGGKPAVATPVPAAKKTLAQIQKEEEARKNRVAAAAAAAANASSSSSSNIAATAGGKRYADLAGKAGQPASIATNAAWTTVGAGGKVKTPTASTPTIVPRTNSGHGVQASTSVTKPKLATPTSAKTNQQTAYEELQKWTKAYLSKGLDSKIPLDGFVTSLLDLPPEPDIISDSIYANSTTLDGRHFAIQFVKLRKDADKGISPGPSSTSGSAMTFSPSSGGGSDGGKAGSGGWSEVAKKGGQGSTAGTKDDGVGGSAGGAGGAQFKMVSGKKKFGKR